MRAFWIIVVLLVAGAGAASWYSSAERGKNTEVARQTSAEEPRRSGEPAHQPDRAGTASKESQTPDGSDASKPPAAPEPRSSTPNAPQTPPAEADQSKMQAPAPAGAEEPKTVTAGPAPATPTSPTSQASATPASSVTPPPTPEPREVARGDEASPQTPPTQAEGTLPATSQAPEAVKSAPEELAKAVEQAVAEAAGSPSKDAATPLSNEKGTPANSDANEKPAKDVAKPAEAPAIAPAANVSVPPAAPAAGGGSGSTPKTEAKNGEAPAADLSPIPAKFENLPNGSIKVDGRFIVKGEGTQQKPYEVTWDQLVSVSELYNPRDGKKRLPERVTMLDGKYVKISGYVAFPLYVDKPKELLSMLNQWDGCCIGVPPTPFDAVEVRMKAAIEGGDRYATQGEVSGKFGVKPYLAGDWLVGLYVMDDAVLSTKSTAGSSRN